MSAQCQAVLEAIERTQLRRALESPEGQSHLPDNYASRYLANTAALREQLTTFMQLAPKMKQREADM